MDRLALIAGNVFLGLAALLYFVPYQMVLAEEPRQDGGLLWGHVFLQLPLFVLFGFAYSAVVWRGGLDAWGWPRVGQYSFVWGACLTLVAASFCSAVFRSEPVQHVPWVVRPLLGWAAYVVPLLLLAVAALWLNAVVPAQWLRTAFAVAGGLGLALGAALLGEGFVAMGQGEAQRIAERQAYDDRRDQMILAEVEAADPVAGFGSLLPHTSKWENEQIRGTALRKVRSVPDLPALLQQHLRNMYYADALTFLRDNDVPGSAALAEAVRDALELAGRNLRGRVEESRDLWRDDLESDAAKVREVAAKFGGYGVDLRAVVNDYEGLLVRARQMAR
ncbi:MAG: hypothetical protein JNK87_10965 [Bryobacterales bacterium]|nr:hypothetical protein [Bryobacterales bacterium]